VDNLHDSGNTTFVVYNNDYRCNADYVDIKGGGAYNAKGTACATFKES
jgi:hypothetical protein